MSATADRRFDEVGRQMARWLAENDPHDTPFTDALGIPADLRANAARVEQIFGDTAVWFAKGYFAGIQCLLDDPDLLAELRGTAG
jgi:hypothetical protein